MLSHPLIAEANDGGGEAMAKAQHSTIGAANTSIRAARMHCARAWRFRFTVATANAAGGTGASRSPG